jgi:hypothetical protein
LQVIIARVPQRDRLQRVRQLTVLQRPFVVPVAQGLADGLAAGGTLASLDGPAHGLVISAVRAIVMRSMLLVSVKVS